jgi:hypothetical protein
MTAARAARDSVAGRFELRDFDLIRHSHFVIRH